MTWILHASDPHLGDISPGQSLDDDKLDIAREDLETTQQVFRRTLDGLASFVAEHGRPTAAVFSGDLAYQADKTGFQAFEKLLVDAAPLLPDQRRRIVVVPGNHDVVWGTEAGTKARYAPFMRATRRRGCTTPLLDGIDFSTRNNEKIVLPDDLRRHLIADDDVVIVPVNSSNYCGTTPRVRGGYKPSEWERASTKVRALAKLADEHPTVQEESKTFAERLHKEVERLRQHDIARVSRRQLLAVAELLRSSGVPPQRQPGDHRLRIAVLHHQLLPVSTREEWKTFESIINLGLLREQLVTFGFDLVLHGHKHAGHVYWDHATGPDHVHAPDRRMLVIAGPGHFGVGEPVLRAMMLEGPRAARNLRIRTFAGLDAGAGTPATTEEVVPLWRARMDAEHSRAPTLHGATTHDVYSRLCAHFEQTGSDSARNVVCDIADSDAADTLPADYPPTGRHDAQAWFEEIVGWWQKDRSVLVPDVIGFNHGERIYTRWGDQVERAARSLGTRSESSRSLITLISPKETGRYPDDGRPLDTGTYPAFVMAEFMLAERNGHTYLDCTATFRKQEMRYWWPINVAEIAALQRAVIAEMETKPAPRPGAIVTVSNIAIYGATLPRVAVLELDRLVEDPADIWALAEAVVAPDTTSEPTRARWRHILDELGRTPESPPIPKVGHHRLVEALERALALKPSSKARTITKRLTELVAIYDAVGAAGSPQAAALIAPAREKFTTAVAPLVRARAGA
ncbi:MAG: metallophosphoesterase [Thermoleophilaceae bacterium]|nr:metallophosphoesterase [Thermoleophilaceae bacterium]